MRPLSLVLLATAALVAALVLPTAVLAGGPSAAARSFEITGLLLGDQKAEASGKLSLEGSQLSASVGCNTVGGEVGVDGDTVTISGPLAMTAMGCPSTIGDVEGMLIKILQHGPFRIGDGAWAGDGASILVRELAAGVPPIGPHGSAPDDSVTSSPGSVITDPLASCPPAPSGLNVGVPVEVGPGSAVGGGGSNGSTGTTVTPGQEDPKSSGLLEAAPSAIPAPDAVGTVDPDPGFTGVGSDPGVGKPVIIDPCAREYAVDQASANAAGAVPPQAGDATAERAGTTNDASALVLPIGAAIILAGGIALVVGRRWRAAHSAGAAAGETATPR